jgi:F420-0:gamma-glutamyl ligase
MGQADEAVPAVLVRGLPFEFDEQATISTLLK